MNESWWILLLVLLPGGGNFVGGMIAEFWRTSPQLLNWALHGASGIVIAIVAVELMPEAMGKLAGWWIAAAFAIGGVTYIAIEGVLERIQWQAGGRGKDARTGMWMIYVAVAVDLSSDGLMLGTGSAVSPALALALAAGQVLADIPEGYATVANFRDKKIPRTRRILLSASFFLFVVGAALLSFFLLQGASEAAKMAALVYVAGLLTVAAVEDMLEEAHEARADNRRSILAFVAGFAVFVLVSAGLETILRGSGGSCTAIASARQDANSLQEDKIQEPRSASPG